MELTASVKAFLVLERGRVEGFELLERYLLVLPGVREYGVSHEAWCHAACIVRVCAIARRTPKRNPPQQSFKISLIYFLYFLKIIG
jgi:hypothetical protein